MQKETAPSEGKTVKKVCQKLSSHSAFTLAETLITVLILLMVSAVVAGGIPAASNAYAKAVDAANAHVLLSTTVNALRSELSTAWNVESAKDGNGISYSSSTTGSQSKLFISGGMIMLQEYSDYKTEDSTESTPAVPPRPIVSEAMTIKGKLSIACDGITYNQETGIVTVKGLQVLKGRQPIVKMPNPGLVIRVITKEASA